MQSYIMLDEVDREKIDETKETNFRIDYKTNTLLNADLTPVMIQCRSGLEELFFWKIIQY